MDPLPTIVVSYAADCYTWDLDFVQFAKYSAVYLKYSIWLFLKEAYWLNQEKKQNVFKS
jgi:hypothetical protein